ncbi:MAG: septation protein SpoVG family protein [Candidatus Omnitrophica bacterium]|nr:septation protein SpoVG family protein [Candidatus Omnitrophota bacterium]
METVNQTENAFHVARIYKLNGDGEGPLKAFCDLIVGDKVLVKGIRVVEGKNGLFVGMPRRQGTDGKWYDTVFPLSKEVRRTLQEEVLAAYAGGPNK